MSGRIVQVRDELRAIAAALDPALLTTADAAGLVPVLAQIEKTAAGLRALVGRRAAEGEAWRVGGHRSPAEWLAKQAGTTVGAAVDAIETAERMEDLPATAAALREGKLSPAQAKEIASAAAVAPSAEGELLRAASSAGLAGLRKEAERIRAASADAASRAERLHRQRSLRTWTDPDGAFRLDARLTPDAGAKVAAALQPFRQRIFDEARQRGDGNRSRPTPPTPSSPWLPPPLALATARVRCQDRVARQPR